MSDCEELLSLWDTEGSSRSITELRRGLSGVSIGEMKESLRRLRDEGLIERQGRAWALTQQGMERRKNLAQEADDPGTRAVDGQGSGGLDPDGKADIPRPSPATPEDREAFGVFQRVLDYYIDCVYHDERPNISLYADDRDREFLPLDLRADWWNSEKVGGLQCPIRDSQAPFRRRLAGLRTEEVYIGYPVFVLNPRDEDYALIVPIFCIPVSVEPDVDSLYLTCDLAAADVNASWLEKHFSRPQEGQQFVRAADLTATDSVETDDGAGFLSVPTAASAIRAFCGDEIVSDQLDPRRVSALIDYERSETGIHNAAVLFPAKKLKYHAGLVSELKKIRGASLQDVKNTALWHVFGPAGQSEPGSGQEEAVRENKNRGLRRALPFLRYNYEQEEAINDALTKDLTVITGPPGTGKSQVAANLMANLAARGDSALFASHNHKALEAVVPRTNDILPDTTLMVRASDPETGQKFNWKKAIQEVLARPQTDVRQGEYARVSRELKSLLKERDSWLDAAEKWTEVERGLGRLTEHWENQTRHIDESVLVRIVAGEVLPDAAELDRLREAADSYPQGDDWFAPVRRLWWKLLRGRHLWGELELLQETCASLNLPPIDPKDDEHLCEAVSARCSKLLGYVQLHETREELSQVREKARCLPPLEEAVDKVDELQGKIRRVAPELLRLSMQKRYENLSASEKKRLIQLKTALSSGSASVSGDGGSPGIERLFRKQHRQLVKFFPLWAVTNLSAHRALPLASGLLDCVVIDEASQCDIASIVPLLYRARRAVVVGDPNQLTAVHKLKTARNQELKRRNSLTSPEYGHLDYLHVTAYELAELSTDDTTMLRDHFRCHEDIVSYVNETFYGESLRVLTGGNKTRIPSGFHPGIMWSDVEGIAEAASSGSTCQAEMREVKTLLGQMFDDDEFTGTIGVVSPFRAQARRIGDWAERAVPREQLERRNFISDTANGFQGDERDVIVFSICLQPEIPRGSRWFIANHPNLWNVAVSRARALLHVVGNHEMCLGSDIEHVSKLARWASKSTEAPPEKGNFDSVWEKRLSNALEEAGISTVSQYPLAGKRLDLAIPEAKLDVEVDGEKYHRDSSGRRKSEDLWRDMTVRAAGWRPLRFWVYELDEDMDGCVQRVKEAIEEGPDGTQ